MYQFEININKKIFLETLLYKIKRVKKNIEQSQITDVYPIFIMSLVGMIGYLFCGLLKDDNCDLESIVVLITSIVVLVVIHFVWGRYTYLRFLETNVSIDGTVLGRWLIEINDNGIVKSKKSCSIKYQWSCVKYIERDKDYLYMFFDVMEAIVLPLNHIPNGLEKYLVSRLKEEKENNKN